MKGLVAAMSIHGTCSDEIGVSEHILGSANATKTHLLLYTHINRNICDLFLYVLLSLRIFVGGMLPAVGSGCLLASCESTSQRDKMNTSNRCQPQASVSVGLAKAKDSASYSMTCNGPHPCTHTHTLVYILHT